MALKLYNETDIEAIADAIRGKNGSSDTYKVSEMADAIDDIPTGGGGSLPASCKFYARVTPTSDATWNNRLSFEAPIVANYSVMLINISQISPPATGYTALWESDAKYINSEGKGVILRANGTQGSDGTMISYNASTGEIKVGGSYGTLFAGDTYDIYLFEHGGINV